MQYAADLTQLIGHTPLVRINKLNAGPGTLYAKLEMFNPYSVKDRPALAMLQAAEKSGLLHKGDTIVEPTSGNTGIALAFLCAVKGYHMILVMPENMSPERVKLVRALGRRSAGRQSGYFCGRRGYGRHDYGRRTVFKKEKPQSPNHRRGAGGLGRFGRQARRRA